MSGVTIGSMCTGYGGLDLAVEAVTGGTTAWVSDPDAGARVILEQRFPHAPNLGDLTKVKWGSEHAVDVLTAGYPCQPFSKAGSRKGTTDERHIWPHIADAVRVLRPSLVVLENVPGHLSLGFGDVLGDLAGMGYDAQWGVVRAADAGAPHLRARVWVVAYPAGERWERTGHEGSEAIIGGGSGHGVSVEAAGQATRGGGIRPDAVLIDELMPTPTVMHMGNKETPQVWITRRADVIARTGTHHGLPLPVLALSVHDGNPIRTSAPMKWRPQPEAPTSLGPYQGAVTLWESILGRPAPPMTLPTGKGVTVHQLSPAFVEWMMGLPNGWITDTPLPRQKQLKALGNGVVPQQAALAIRALLGVAAV